jgi:hypothetical protein
MMIVLPVCYGLTSQKGKIPSVEHDVSEVLWQQLSRKKRIQNILIQSRQARWQLA